MLSPWAFFTSVMEGFLRSCEPPTAQPTYDEQLVDEEAENEVHEPPLTADEIVAVRQLIEERFGESVEPGRPAGDDSILRPPCDAPPAGLPSTSELLNMAAAALGDRHPNLQAVMRDRAAQFKAIND